MLTCCESSLLSPKRLRLASLHAYSVGKPNNIRHHHIVEAENVFLFEGKSSVVLSLYNLSDVLKCGSSGMYVELWQERERSFVLQT